MDRELLKEIQNYLNGYCTLQDLESWILSNLQTILESGDESTIHAVNQLDADFVELSEGLINEASIREHLQNYASIKETIESDFFDTVQFLNTEATTVAVTIRYHSEVMPVVNLHCVHQFA